MSTEDDEIYWQLFARVADCIKPENVIEWMWLKDVVDHGWEIQRLRRYKALFVELARGVRAAKMEEAEQPRVLFMRHASELVARPKRRKKVKLNTEMDSAIAFKDCMHSYDLVDKLLASAELRRSALLRDIQFHRENFAQRLEEASDNIIDAEYEESTATEGSDVGQVNGQ